MDMTYAIVSLGMNPEAHFRSMLSMTRRDKIAAAEAFLVEAKKRARSLMIRHHPDKGGNADEFKKVSAAIEFLEKETAQFKQKMEALIKDSEERASASVRIVKS